MTNLLNKKPWYKKIPVFNKTVLTVVASLLIGGLATNLADAFIANHTFFYQSPVVIQSPVIISTKPLISPIVLIRTVEANVSATPEPSIQPVIKKY